MPETPSHIGPYEVLEAVGKGGMATVFRGRRRETGQIVAIKSIDPRVAANPVLMKRFEQEYAAASRLRHPNIIQVWDFGLDEGRPYLVMEFIDGENLGKRIARRGPLPEAEAVPIILQVADGLHSAHQHQMIHRDVKPENILLSRDGQAKLTDLGLIKDLNNGEPLTRTRTTLGTIAFIAPEQFEDAKRAGVRCDIYGLGATLYHALTGILPFQGRRNLQILRKKLLNDFVPPHRLAPAVSARVDAAISRALDADPDKRQASCREFMDSIAPESLRPAEPGTITVAEPLGSPEDRRRALRYPASLDATCRSLQSGRNQWPARIQDISGTGLRLTLERRFEPGAVLAVEVLDEGAGVPTLYAKVIWAREVGPRSWCLGCRFRRELNQGELETLLGDKPKTVMIHRD